jgi:integrase
MSGRRDPGDGGIDARGQDRWRLRYRVGGKRYAKAFHGTITEAKRELRRLLKSADDGMHVAPGRTTLATWIVTWLALIDRSVNPKTLERYGELLRLHVQPALGDRPLQAIKVTEVDDLYRRLGDILAPRTVHHVHTVFNACFKAAVRKGLVLHNPVALAEVPSPGDRDAATTLDRDQLTALVDGFRGSALFSIVAIAAYTGARRGEILALRWVDFDRGAKTLRIERAIEDTKSQGIRLKGPKTERGKRTIAIDDGLVALLSAEREKHVRLSAGIPDGAAADLSLVKLPEGALMFPSPARDFDLSRPRRPRNVTKEFVRRASKLGFPSLRFHDLRGTHETLLLDAGVPVHVVAARCGHDPAVLLRSYARRTRKADTSAAAIIGALSRSVLSV